MMPEVSSSWLYGNIAATLTSPNRARSWCAFLERKVVKFFCGFGSDHVFQVDLPRACMYEVRLFNFAPDVKGGDWTTYTVNLNHLK